MGKMDKIKQRYSHEINEIQHRLNLLEQGKIKELTHANMDGYLATNIINLRKKLNKLMYKVVNDSKSVSDEFNEFFK